MLLSGLGPALAWRRTTAANLRRELLAAGRDRRSRTLVVLLAAGVERRPAALAMFCLGAFVVAVVAQEFARGVRARRAMSSEACRARPSRSCAATAAATAATSCTWGSIVLLVGVAASSTFQDARDVRLAPGERAQVGGYEIQYLRPTGRLDLASNGSLEKINLGADLRVRRDGEDSKLHTERSYFPSNSAGLGAVSRYFEGEATSEVGLRAGLGHDLWTVVAPDTGLLRRHDQARRPRVRSGRRSCRPPSARPLLGETLRRLVARYPAAAPPARSGSWCRRS